VSFHVSDDVLERLEWPVLAARLMAGLRSAAGRARLASDPGAARSLFEADVQAVRAKLAETSDYLTDKFLVNPFDKNFRHFLDFNANPFGKLEINRM
jgi:hypothetical protein